MILIKNQQKIRKISLRKIKRLVNQALTMIDAREKEISLVICDNKFIQQINKKFFSWDNPTDVIAFPLEDFNDNLWGEIIVSLEEAVNYSLANNIDWEEELARYIVHGILHLAGYSDSEIKEKRKMFAKQEKIIQNFKQKGLC